MNDVQTAEQQILRVLKEKGTAAPADLLKDLLGRQMATDQDFREAMWRLIDRKAITLTPNRKLQLAEDSQPVPAR